MALTSKPEMTPEKQPGRQTFFNAPATPEDISTFAKCGVSPNW